MRDENIPIKLSEINGIDLLSFFLEYIRTEFGLESMREDGVRDTASLVVDAFIESFPYHQVSQVDYEIKQKTPLSVATVEATNIQEDTPFDFRYGSWFVCSEYPLVLKFKEHNELLGYGARIPSGNRHGRFARWAAKVLHATKATCIGVMDLDSCELAVCFWPVELKVIESHLQPILDKYGLGISKQ